MPFWKLPTLPADLKCVVEQWDDTDEATLAASKAHLNALGPQAFEELSAYLLALHSRTMKFNYAGGVQFCVFVITLFLFLACPVSQPGAPAAQVFTALALAFSPVMTAVLTLLLGSRGVTTKLTSNAVKAVASYSNFDAVNLLLVCFTVAPLYAPPTSETQTSVIQVCRNCLTQLLDETAPQTFAFPPSTLRRVRRQALSGFYVTAALMIRLLARADDGAMLPKIKRRAAKAEDWELVAACNEYFARFAPECVVEQVEEPIVVESDTDTAALAGPVMRLGSRNPEERAAGAAAIRRLSPEQLSRLLDVLLQVEPPRVRRKRVGMAWLWTLTGALAGPAAYLMARYGFHLNPKIASGLLFYGLYLGGILGNIKFTLTTAPWRNKRRAQMLGSPSSLFPQKRVLETLETLDNVELIGALIDHLPAAEYQSTVRDSLWQALLRLLPQLRASDAGLLSSRHQRILNQELARKTWRYSPAWAGANAARQQAERSLAILKAWEQIGDAQALPLVQKLADAPARLAAKKRVREAAAECLPYLEARADEQRQTQTLLRASDAPTEAGDVLLRAATAHSTPVEAEQLLRAGIRNNNE